MGSSGSGGQDKDGMEAGGGPPAAPSSIFGGEISPGAPLGPILSMLFLAVARLIMSRRLRARVEDVMAEVMLSMLSRPEPGPRSWSVSLLLVG